MLSINAVRDKRHGTLPTTRWVVAGRRRVESNFIVSGLQQAPQRRGSGGFEIVIDIGTLHHLLEVDRHAIKDLSRLCVGIHLFMAKRSNTSRAVKELRR